MQRICLEIWSCMREEKVINRFGVFTLVKKDITKLVNTIAFMFVLMPQEKILGGGAEQFLNNWQDMQFQYQQLNLALENAGLKDLEKKYCGTYWQEQKNKLNKIILGPANFQIWKENFLINDMVRTGIHLTQLYEQCFIKHCISYDILKKIKAYKDTDFNSFPFECREFNCSTNTLGHLFFAAKTLDRALQYNLNIMTIVELGGGYGNLARIFKTILPLSTYIIIDLPEYIALQYLFLKSTIENEQIVVCFQLPENLDSGKIYLVPVSSIDSIKLGADLFISTFALSECPKEIQTLVADKRFFNAKISYITGQIDGWNLNLDFEPHNFLVSSFRTNYKYIESQPFHFLSENMESYELIGHN